jgi:hypothetical protein
MIDARDICFELTPFPESRAKAEKVEKMVKECLYKGEEFIYKTGDGIELHFNSMEEIEAFVRCHYCKWLIGMCRHSCIYCKNYVDFEKLDKGVLNKAED